MDTYTLINKLSNNRDDESGFNQVLREYAAYRLDGEHATTETPAEQEQLRDDAASTNGDLAKTLTPEQMGMLLDYEAQQGLYWASVEQDAYLLGLQDGIMLVEILRHFDLMGRFKQCCK